MPIYTYYYQSICLCTKVLAETEWIEYTVIFYLIDKSTHTLSAYFFTKFENFLYVETVSCRLMLHWLISKFNIHIKKSKTKKICQVE